MSDETQTIDPLADPAPAPAKPKAVKVSGPKRRLQPGLKEIRPAEPTPELDAAPEALEAEIEAPAEELPDGPGDYRVSLRDCKEIVVKNATGRDHAIRAFMRHYGVLNTEHQFEVTKVA